MTYDSNGNKVKGGSHSESNGWSDLSYRYVGDNLIHYSANAANADFSYMKEMTNTYYSNGKKKTETTKWSNSNLDTFSEFFHTGDLLTKEVVKKKVYSSHCTPITVYYKYNALGKVTEIKEVDCNGEIFSLKIITYNDTGSKIAYRSFYPDVSSSWTELNDHSFYFFNDEYNTMWDYSLDFDSGNENYFYLNESNQFHYSYFSHKGRYEQLNKAAGKIALLLDSSIKTHKEIPRSNGLVQIIFNQEDAKELGMKVDPDDRSLAYTSSDYYFMMRGSNGKLRTKIQKTDNKYYVTKNNQTTTYSLNNRGYIESIDNLRDGTKYINLRYERRYDSQGNPTVIREFRNEKLTKTTNYKYEYY